MGIRDSIRAFNGVQNYISKSKFDLGKPRNKSFRAADEHLNDIFIRFGNDHELKMERNNSPKYKGTYQPVVSNAVRIQENWVLFKTWMEKNFKKKPD